MSFAKLTKLFIAVLIGTMTYLLQANANEVPGNTYEVYLLSGQSNMAGFGSNRKIPSDLLGEQDNVFIFHGRSEKDKTPATGTGKWARLQPGHGAGFSATEDQNSYSHRFGPELTFGSEMARRKPKSKIAIIKYVKGGTALQIGAGPGGTWNPAPETTTQYDHLLATIKNAMSTKDIDGDGKEDRLIPKGIVWYQGAGDASHTLGTAQAYEERLERWLKLVRAALGDSTLPVVVVKITDSGQDDDGKVMDYGDIVQKAQENIVRRDPYSSLVKTDGYEFRNDRWHFKSKAYLKMGTAFADAMVKPSDRLRSDPPKKPRLDLSQYALAFEEQFNELDVSAWGPGTRWIAHTPWNGDFGKARYSNPKPGFPFTIHDGVLHIEARKLADGTWRSGLLASVDRSGRGFSQKYGYFEMRAKLPPGKGLWPAFWLIGRKGDQHTAEIDIIEHYGHMPDRYSMTVHAWDRKNGENNRSSGKRHIVPKGSLYDRFNTFGASVDHDWIVFYFNREEVWRTPTDPVHRQNLYVLLNLAMGPWPIDESPNPSVMEVDYVKVWKRKEHARGKIGEPRLRAH